MLHSWLPVLAVCEHTCIQVVLVLHVYSGDLINTHAVQTLKQHGKQDCSCSMSVHRNMAIGKFCRFQMMFFKLEMLLTVIKVEVYPSNGLQGLHASGITAMNAQSQ